MSEKYYFVYDDEWVDTLTEREVLEFAQEQFYDKQEMFDYDSLIEFGNTPKDKKAYKLGQKILSGYDIQTVDEAKVIFSIVDFKVKQLTYPESPKITIQEYEEIRGI